MGDLPAEMNPALGGGVFRVGLVQVNFILCVSACVLSSPLAALQVQGQQTREDFLVAQRPFPAVSVSHSDIQAVVRRRQGCHRIGRVRGFTKGFQLVVNACQGRFRILSEQMLTQFHDVLDPLLDFKALLVSRMREGEGLETGGGGVAKIVPDAHVSALASGPAPVNAAD